MTDKPEIKIKGSKQDFQKKEKNVKPKYSNFLLTINTNKQYKDDDPHLKNDADIFEDTINDILKHINEYINLPESVIWNNKIIEDVDIDYVVEKGNIKGQLHTHILFKIKHHTNIQLNYNKIKEKIKNDLDLTNIYMYNKLVRNNGSQNIMDYLEKYK